MSDFLHQLVANSVSLLFAAGQVVYSEKQLSAAAGLMRAEFVGLENRNDELK